MRGFGPALFERETMLQFVQNYWPIINLSVCSLIFGFAIWAIADAINGWISK